MTTYNDKLRERNMESMCMEQQYRTTKMWAIIATAVAVTLAGVMFMQHCDVKYERWIKERAICLEQAQYYENAWCDDNNNLVK